jgi:hypothetical protein
MVTFADLREANPNGLQSAGQAWWDRSAALRGYGERLNTEVAGALVGSGWEGDAATVAVQRSEQIEEHFEVGSRVAELVAAVYDSAYDRLWRLQWQLTTAVDSAHTAGLTVREDGAVEAPPSQVPHGVDGGAYHAEQQRLVRDFADRIAEIVTQADEIDQQAAAALAELNPENTQYGDRWRDLAHDAQRLASEYGLGADDIPDEGDPETNAAWWDRLSEAEQAMYLAAYPHQVGDLDGLPVEVRDRANQTALQNVVNSPDSDERSRERAQDLLNRIEESEYGPEHQRLHMIGFDLGGDGQVIMSVGNPDTADQTAVWVPGFDTDFDSTGSNLNRVRNLQQEADGMTPGAEGDVATVMWLGYDTPGADESVGGVLFGGRSEDGAQALDPFIDGLRTTHEGDPGRLTVVGHSYGSTVVGEAASNGDGLAVDDIIVAGSPGMRVDNADDLQVGDGHVWAGAAEGDDVSGIGSHFVHGEEPHKEGFGGNRFEVDTTGHSDYWRKDTLSLRNQAYIVVGQYDKVSLEHGEPPA